MDVSEAPDSGRIYTDSLVEGPIWAGLTLTFSFPTSAAQFTGYAGGEPFNNFEALNATQIAAARAMLGSISGFTNLVFSELVGSEASGAVLRFGMTDAVDTGVVAHAYLPSAAETGGDSWYRNTGGENDNPARGNEAWHTFLHEIGHTLGLGHPHEAVGAEPAMPVDRDAMAYTVMSYSGSPFGSDGWAQTFMIEDLAALQFLYGANFNHNNTDTVYRWNPLTGEMSINGAGQGAPSSNHVMLTVWDGGGGDTYDLSNYSVGVAIDLRPGAWSTLAPDQLPILGGARPGSVANALLYNDDNRSLIENAIGSAGSDIIHGNGAANSLIGGTGDDQIDGYDGNDELVGGTGGDTLSGWAGNDELDGGIGDDRIFGGDGDDMLIGGDGSDSLEGRAGVDHLDGGAGIDYLDGGDGDDSLIGASDGDSMDGGAGDDFLDGGWGDDSLSGRLGIDTLVGGSGNDSLHGGGDDDHLTGGDGDDQLSGGSGNDLMVGGLGNDTYWLQDIGDQFIELPGEGRDTVLAAFDYTAPPTIENIGMIGYGEFSLTGNALDNELQGNPDNNVLDGGAGADIMRGYFGNDTYYVDDPNDLVYENENWGNDTVYSSVSYTLPGHEISPTTLENQIDTLVLLGVANLSATGNTAANTIQGNTGDNRLDGGTGDDNLYGDAGDDLLVSGTGNDSLNGGEGDDGLYFGAAFDGLDSADGGTGALDQLGLQGDYSAGLTLGPGSLTDVEMLVLLAGSDTRFGDPGTGSYSYDLTTVDANVAAGRTFRVSFNTLRAGENLTFDGSAETDGAFLTFSGFGDDDLTGGAGDDGFYFGAGRFGAGEVLDGGAGTLDQLGLQGDYAGANAVTFGASQLAGIEMIVCLTAADARFGGDAAALYDYDLTLHQGNLANGALLEISANTLIAGESLAFDGSAETDGGRFTVYSGDGDDTITGGAGRDTLHGAAGADTLTGRAGADLLRGGDGDDVFAYLAASDSTSAARDSILDFAAGDTIDLSAIDARAGGANNSFTFIGEAAFGSNPGQLRADQQSGTGWLVEGDTNGDGLADFALLVAVTGGHTLVGADFVL